jgi:hypothetical protein
MSKSSWSPAHLSTIGAQLTKLPPHEVIHWQQLRGVKDRIGEIMAEANVALSAIEDDSALTPQGKQQKAAALGKETIAKIEGATDAANKAAQRRIQALETKLASVIEKPADPAVAQEIRAYIKNQASPIMAAIKLKDHKETVAAILGAPPYLSGISEADSATLRAQILSATPEQKEIGDIQQALGVVQNAIRSATSMINARAQTRSAPTLRPAETAKAS